MPQPDRITVLKTSKLYIGGRFVRTESGRVWPAKTPAGDQVANACWASRKDLREAVRAARCAQKGWAAASPYLKGQILYRMAEMLEDRHDTFVNEIVRGGVSGKDQAECEVKASIDRLVYFAGWSDKITAVFGSVNPVSTPHFNFTVPEPTGVVGLVCPDEPSLLALVSMLAASLVLGNAVVAVVSESQPLAGATFGEVLATSDIPAGVVNLLTGKQRELADVLGTHLDVNAIIAATQDPETRSALGEAVATNLKRVSLINVEDWYGPEGEDPYQILKTAEMKTTWHPVGT
ncbi:MAG: aldehyde dehydrogenase family protein [Verrucomicrobiaceae bacterium]|nr:aldehyde dehydrogenase family protein [Verrucomicrobiaceae bacterium]NCF94770.1 aldehyde dehydrogenase family protein [Verrucomicrobiaceae bacterium]